MKKQFEIIENLTTVQRKLFNKDIQQIYLECHKALNGKIQKLIDVTANLNLNDEVYLKVTCEYNNTLDEKVKGKITQLYKYNNEAEYHNAIEIEKLNLN